MSEKKQEEDIDYIKMLEDKAENHIEFLEKKVKEWENLYAQEINEIHKKGLQDFEDRKALKKAIFMFLEGVYEK